MRHERSGWDRSFSWVADPSSHLVVMATTGRYFFRHLGRVPFGEGDDASYGEGLGTLLFLAVRKRRPRHRRLPEEGGAAGESSTFDAFVPFFWRPSLPPFYCLRATEPGTVLTTTSDGSPAPHGRTPGGGWWGQEREGRDLWGVGTPEVFFCSWVGEIWGSFPV